MLQPVLRLSKRALTEGEQRKKSATEKLKEGTGIIFLYFYDYKHEFQKLKCHYRYQIQYNIVEIYHDIL